MAQDVIGRRDVEKELRHAEGQQQRSTGKLSCRTVPEREDYLLFFGAVDLRGFYACHEILRSRNACLEFGNDGCCFRKNRRIDVGEQSAGEHSMPDALADLARQIVHVGVKARVEQNRGIDVALLGVSGRMIEQIGKAFQEV
jgi:hypothetical protein